MMDLEEILKSEDDEALKELKTFLFKEHIRLENEKKELAEGMDKLLKERSQFRTEMDMLNHRIVMEKKRLKDDNLFFEKKMEILRTASGSWTRTGTGWKRKRPALTWKESCGRESRGCPSIWRRCPPFCSGASAIPWL